jgi:osmotically-inducible protein OsmY
LLSVIAIVGWLCIVSSSASAQSPGTRSAQTVAAVPGAAVSANGELRERVQAALHADPYFYDEHVNVTVEQGAVVLSGFVLSDWDLQEAIRIAGKAAGDKRVIDNLSIKQGGRR